MRIRLLPLIAWAVATQALAAAKSTDDELLKRLGATQDRLKSFIAKDEYRGRGHTTLLKPWDHEDLGSFGPDDIHDGAEVTCVGEDGRATNWGAWRAGHVTEKDRTPLRTPESLA